MGNCCLCKLKTSDKKTEGVIVCEVCRDKYGSKLRKKLIEEKIIKDSEKNSTKPFECKLEYSGGSKQDIINLIDNLMDQEDISLNEIRR